MLKLKLKKKHETRIHKGHLWVFSNELEEIPPAAPGIIAELYDTRNNSFGYGFYNPHSLISFRLLKTSEPPAGAFFAERITNALKLRRSVLPGENAYRLVFGESDLLPGLIIDKYEDYFAIQLLAAGMELHREYILEALLKIFPATKGVILKNNSRLRELEGISNTDEIAYGEIPANIHTTENGVKLNISLADGQKTGYFLDQRENRLAVRRFSRGLDVLDCFTNQGGFALNAALGGAKSVTAVDYSQQAIDAASLNAEANKLAIGFFAADVFDYLADAVSTGRKWDMIVLDPPAFTKSKKNIDKAIAGYARLNKLALKALASGGLLVSSSCSHHLPENEFLRIITNECIKQNLWPNIIYRGMQSPDHPVLAAMPETKYLKFYIIKTNRI